MTARKAKRRRPAKDDSGPLNRWQEWTGRELRVLERHFGRMPYKELMARYLPGRTIIAIAHRARLLGLARPREPMRS